MKKLNYILLLMFSLLALTQLGCSKENGSVSSKKMSEMKPGDVLALVNGEELTYSDFQERLKFETEFYRLKNNLKETDPQFIQFKEICEYRLLPVAINTSLVMQDAKKLGVEPDPDILRQNLEDLARSIRVPKPDVGAIAQKMGLTPQYVKLRLREMSMLKSICKAKYPDSLQVSEAEIDLGLERQKKYSERAALSNEVQVAKSKEVLKKIQDGMDFKTAGEKYGEIKQHEAESWLYFSRDEIDNPQLREWAFSAPVGSVGGPFDLPDGISLVKILDRTQGASQSSIVSTKVAEVTLARITFQMVETFDNLRNRKSVKMVLRNYKQQKAKKAIFQSVHEKMRLEFPNGSNFWDEVTEKTPKGSDKQTGEK